MERLLVLLENRVFFSPGSLNKRALRFFIRRYTETPCRSLVSTGAFVSYKIYGPTYQTLVSDGDFT